MSATASTDYVRISLTSNHNFVLVRLRCKPVNLPLDVLDSACICEISGVYEQVPVGNGVEGLVMGVRYANYPHALPAGRRGEWAASEPHQDTIDDGNQVVQRTVKQLVQERGGLPLVGPSEADA